MSDMGGPGAELPSVFGQPIRLPEPPGGFPPPAEPGEPQKRRQGQPDRAAARLPIDSVARAGAVIMGVAVVVVAIVLVVLLAGRH